MQEDLKSGGPRAFCPNEQKDRKTAQGIFQGNLTTGPVSAIRVHSIRPGCTLQEFSLCLFEKSKFVMALHMYVKVKSTGKITRKFSGAKKEGAWEGIPQIISANHTLQIAGRYRKHPSLLI